jgi:hypothetical protein
VRDAFAQLADAGADLRLGKKDAAGLHGIKERQDTDSSTSSE